MSSFPFLHHLSENIINNNNNNNNSPNDKSPIKDLRRRSPSQERAPGSPSYSNGINCGVVVGAGVVGNANGTGGLLTTATINGTETESNSSRGSIGSLGSNGSSRGAEDSNRSSHQSSRDEATATPNCT